MVIYVILSRSIFTWDLSIIYYWIALILSFVALKDCEKDDSRFVVVRTPVLLQTELEKSLPRVSIENGGKKVNEEAQAVHR